MTLLALVLALAAPPPPVHAPAVVGLGWSGRTVWLKPGQSFLLKLGAPPPDWRVEVADRRVLARRVNVAVVRGAQGIYDAKTVGRTTVSAGDHWPCEDATPPCRPPNRIFFLRVVVRR